MLWAPVDIGYPHGFVHSIAVDARGDALVQSNDRDDPTKTVSFVWRRGKVTVLRYGGTTSVGATAMNGRGDVAGDARNEAVLWRKGVPAALGRFEPEAVNDADVVVGDGNVAGGIHAFVWRDGTLTDLPGLGGTETHAWLVDALGDVAGVSALPSGADHAVFWRAGSTTPVDLGSVGRLDSSVDAMNASGTIVGFAGDHEGNGRVALEWTDGRLIVLGRFGADAAQAVAVNRRGDVLVQTQTASGNPRGIVLVRDGRAIRIPALGNGPVTARGLADDGTVLGFGMTPGHGRRSFVWRNGKTTILPTTDGARPPWGAANAIAGRYAIGDEYVPLKDGQDTSHAVLWRYEAKTSR